MNRLFLLLMLVSAASSCQSPQRQAANQAADDQYCRSIGASGSTFSQCMMYKDQARREDRQRRNQALMDASAAFNQAAQPQYVPVPRVVTTNCRRDSYGNTHCISQ